MNIEEFVKSDLSTFERVTRATKSRHVQSIISSRSQRLLNFIDWWRWEKDQWGSEFPEEMTESEWTELFESL